MTLGSLILKVGLDGVQRIKSELDNIKKAFHDTGDSAESAGNQIREGIGGGFESAITVANNAIDLFTKVKDVIAAPFEQAVTMDNLMRGLTAVAGTAQEAQRQFERLKEVAKAPGLGLEEAVKGSIRLQSAGLSALTAERALKAFGNAIATVGGGKSELDGVTLALTQIATKGKVSAEEINQLRERLPQIGIAMKAAFGTADTEQLAKMGVDSETFINKIINEFEKARGVVSGIGNDMESFGDTTKLAMAAFGRAMIPVVETVLPPLTRSIENLTPLFESAARSIERFTQSETLTKFANNAVLSFNTLKNVAGMAAGVIAGIVTFNTLSGIITAVQAVIKLTSAIRAAGLAAAITEGIVNPFALGAGLVAAGVGVAAYFGTNALFNQLDKGVTKPDISALTSPDMTGSTTTSSVATTATGAKTGGMGNILELLAQAGTIALKHSINPKSKQDKNEAYLSKIAENTGKTYDAISLRRQAMGGGELGQMGVTPAEMSGSRGASGAPFGGHFLGNSIQEMFNDMGRRMEDMVNQASVRAVLSNSPGVGRYKPR